MFDFNKAEIYHYNAAPQLRKVPRTTNSSSRIIKSLVQRRRREQEPYEKHLCELNLVIYLVTTCDRGKIESQPWETRKRSMSSRSRLLAECSTEPVECVFSKGPLLREVFYIWSTRTLSVVSYCTTTVRAHVFGTV